MCLLCSPRLKHRLSKWHTVSQEYKSLILSIKFYEMHVFNDYMCPSILYGEIVSIINFRINSNTYHVNLDFSDPWFNVEVLNFGEIYATESV